MGIIAICKKIFAIKTDLSVGESASFLVRKFNIPKATSKTPTVRAITLAVSFSEAYFTCSINTVGKIKANIPIEKAIHATIVKKSLLVMWVLLASGLCVDTLVVCASDHVPSPAGRG